MRPCPDCGRREVLFDRTVYDRRGTDRVPIQRGTCQDCGVGVRKDTTTGEVVAFGPVAEKTEADAVLELRRRAGARLTNYTHYCPVCDEEWETPVDHDHDLFVWPAQAIQNGKRVGGWCEHSRTERVRTAPDGSPTEDLETLDAEVVTMDSENPRSVPDNNAAAASTEAGGTVGPHHRSITIECRRVFEDPREAANHEYDTDHDVHIELVDLTE